MRFQILSLLAVFSLPMFAANVVIELEPGATATIKASEETKAICKSGVVPDTRPFVIIPRETAIYIVSPDCQKITQDGKPSATQVKGRLFKTLDCEKEKKGKFYVVELTKDFAVVVSTADVFLADK